MATKPTSITLARSERVFLGNASYLYTTNQSFNAAPFHNKLDSEQPSGETINQNETEQREKSYRGFRLMLRPCLEIRFEVLTF